MQELILRRHWAETPLFFDAARAQWQRRMRRAAEMRVPVKRDRAGRFVA